MLGSNLFAKDLLEGASFDITIARFMCTQYISIRWISGLVPSISKPKREISWRITFVYLLLVRCCWVRIYMTSSNGNIFRVAGPLWGKSTGHRWIPLTKASDAEFWYFLLSAPEQTLEQTNRDTDDLRRHRAHYDVTVITRNNNDLVH